MSRRQPHRGRNSARQPSPSQDTKTMDFDKLYYERIATAVTAAIDAASTAPISGTIHVKPTEASAALAALLGRLLGHAEQVSGKKVPDEMLGTLKGLIDDNLKLVRAIGEAAEALKTAATAEAEAPTPANDEAA